MFYLDASAAVAAIAQETHSEAIWGWLGEHAAEPILCSGWTATEVASALSIKVRTGAYTMEDRVTAWNNWRRFRQDNLAEISVAPDHFETAARFLDRPDLGLRAGDALHIAIAESAGLRLVTFDTRMADAALQLGIPVERI
ncbi:putative nucleic acid-binding protein [Sphingomonas kyeonggiensis]|uniref:Ribonuclease VapC n=1 Tax=Sphingomonas kyeonggiensis TaxID=1268553 RepID=A0A7W7NSQ3_9SPHN|nr:type II toxin-antitoxin system VapC family toxin [Sphingomonas kyeonggiensis]MBB4838879.1 putative nucleic acid-binding protein [Sphingomonas kyeonggiensis]